MTGYEFTREIWDASTHRNFSTFRSRTLTQDGQIKLCRLLNEQELLRSLVDSKVSNIIDRSQYKETYNAYIDFTMSCDYEEAKSWVRQIIREAIAYTMVPRQGEETDWIYLFSAAYDLYEHLEDMTR